MSVEPGPIRTAVERITGPDFVRRVERDEGAQEFGQKNRDSRQGGKRQPAPSDDLTAPQDVVDLSADYHAPGTPHAPAPPAPALPPGKQARLPSAPRVLLSPAQDSPDRHIDIQV